jgi:hypothetical protein
MNFHVQREFFHAVRENFHFHVNFGPFFTSSKLFNSFFVRSNHENLVSEDIIYLYCRLEMNSTIKRENFHALREFFHAKRPFELKSVSSHTSENPHGFYLHIRLIFRHDIAESIVQWIHRIV